MTTSYIVIAVVILALGVVGTIIAFIHEGNAQLDATMEAYENALQYERHRLELAQDEVTQLHSLVMAQEGELQGMRELHEQCDHCKAEREWSALADTIREQWNLS